MSQSGSELRDIFNRPALEFLAGLIRARRKQFATKEFTDGLLKEFPALGLRARSQAIAGAWREMLPGQAEEQLEFLLTCLPGDDGSGGVEGMGGFRFLPFLDFVEQYLTETPEPALAALNRLTLYFSAEWAVRPYLRLWPKESWAAVDQWSTAPDWRHRRLASEGTRPRLPWGAQLKDLIKDPKPCLPILARLKADPELIVRRSVANHLNDIGKDHPDLAAKLGADWLKAGDDSAWTARHGLRSLIKQGHPAVMAAFGVGDAKGLAVEALTVSPRRAKLGGEVILRFTLVNQTKKPRKVAADYGLIRPLATGGQGRKIFKLAEFELAPGAGRNFEKKVGLKQLSTRTFYPGKYRLEVQVNGSILASAEFSASA